MSNLLGWCPFGLTLALCLTFAGCGGHSGGVVEETDEMTFDDLAEMAAQETEISESGEESAEK